MTQNTGTPPETTTPARKKRRNMRPCFACSMQKSRCTLVAQNLCENCQRAGRAQCVPHIPWRNIRAAQSTTRQSFTEGPLSLSMETPTSGTNSISPQAYSNGDNVEIQVQEWQTPNDMVSVPLSSHGALPYHFNLPISLPLQPEFFAPLPLDNRGFNAPFFPDPYVPHPDAPLMPPHMESFQHPDYPGPYIQTSNSASGSSGNHIIQEELRGQPMSDWDWDHNSDTRTNLPPEWL